MTTDNLTEIFQLYSQGFVVGSTLTGLPFLLGWCINYVISLVKGA